jgi:hypothetical protein
MDPARFEDRHTLLDPQDRVVGLGKEESGPAAIARMRGEDFG